MQAEVGFLRFERQALENLKKAPTSPQPSPLRPQGAERESRPVPALPTSFRGQDGGSGLPEPVWLV